MEFWFSLDSGLQTAIKLGAAATGVLAVVGLYRWVRPIAIGCYEIMVLMLNYKEAHQEIVKKVPQISAEMTSNGGSSFKDMIMDVKDDLAYMRAFQMGELDMHHSAAFITDAQGNCIRTNRLHSRLTGFPMAEMLGKGWINCIAPGHRARTMEMWLHAVEDKRDFNEDLNYIMPDDTQYKVHVNAYTLRNEKTGEILGYRGDVRKV